MKKIFFKTFTAIFVFLFINSHLIVKNVNANDDNPKIDSSSNKLLAAKGGGGGGSGGGEGKGGGGGGSGGGGKGGGGGGSGGGKGGSNGSSNGGSKGAGGSSSGKSGNNSNSKGGSSSGNKSNSGSKSANGNNSKTGPAGETGKKATGAEMEVDSHTQATTGHFDREGNFVGKGKGGYDKDGNKLSKGSGSDGKGGGNGSGKGKSSGGGKGTPILEGGDDGDDYEEEEKEEKITWTYSGSGCSSYIHHWDIKWEPCEIDGNWAGYSNPNVNCRQKPIYIPRYNSCGTSYTSSKGEYRCDTSGCGNNAPKPFFPDKIRNIKMQHSGSTCPETYANGIDTCGIFFTIGGFPTPKEGLKGFNNPMKNFEYTGAVTDQVGKIGRSGLKIENTSMSNSLYSATAKASSIVPFHDYGETLSFDIGGKNGFSRVGFSPLPLSMKEPAELGKLTIEEVEGGSDKPELGRHQKYNISVKALATLNHVSNSTLEITDNEIEINQPFKYLFRIIHKISFKNPSAVLNNIFEQIIDTENESKENILNKEITVRLKSVPISYTINGRKVRYYVGSSEAVKGCKKSTLGARLVGFAKYQGKGNKTGQDEDSTDLSSDIVRKYIHKNATDLIRNRNESKGQVLNEVYFNDKDTKYSEIEPKLKDGNTIIIKDANFIIDKDFSENKKLGIIVLKDDYKVIPETLNGGNIFIKNTVKKINAYIYADGALMSRNENGKAYSDDQLATPLEINGSIFSRNTIGGAIAGIKDDKSYVLPGGEKIKDFEGDKLKAFKIAEKYDLNYLRKSTLCKEEDFSVRINYDPKIQINPPKGFTTTN
ncbi:hypothetical protein BLD25_04245 [Candidatus Gracilibacteria bacterium GN02-872]|nr:hypothetical protein BLD25_04245 [Candidatus Gracilibacteria bacterium GN02-872]